MTDSGGVKEQAGAAAGTAAEQAGQVAATAKDQAATVAGEAREQTAAVAGQATEQVRQLAGQATDEVKAQANQQTERLADGLRSFAGQIQALVEGDQANAGPLPAYARQATDQLQQLAGQIGDRGFDGVVDDVQRFARRRPGLFLAGAAAAGFLGGRLLRGAQAASQQPQQAQVGGAHTTGQLPMPGQLAGATADQTDVIVLSESATAPAEGTTGVTSTPVGGAR
jgi:hypothetical protein